MEKKTPPIIALITDFGYRDWYAGSIKGKLQTYCPGAKIVDISHSIPPGDIHSASYVLASCIKDFPPNTLFLCVVDPGVGTNRKAIMGRIGKYTVICPNNGLISNAFRLFPENTGPFYEVLPSQASDEMISATFHGRDVFAPITGKVASGSIEIKNLGNIVNDLVMLDLPKPEIKKGVISGVISYIDQFGNAITNISKTELGLFAIRSSAYVVIKGIRISLKTTFAEVEVGQPLTYVGSNGFLEVGMNQQNAAMELKLAIGTSIRFYPKASIDPLPNLKTISHSN